MIEGDEFVLAAGAGVIEFEPGSEVVEGEFWKLIFRLDMPEPEKQGAGDGWLMTLYSSGEVHYPHGETYDNAIGFIARIELQVRHMLRTGGLGD